MMSAIELKHEIENLLDYRKIDGETRVGVTDEKTVLDIDEIIAVRMIRYAQNGRITQYVLLKMQPLVENKNIKEIIKE